MAKRLKILSFDCWKWLRREQIRQTLYRSVLSQPANISFQAKDRLLNIHLFDPTCSLL